MALTSGADRALTQPLFERSAIIVRDYEILLFPFPLEHDSHYWRNTKWSCFFVLPVGRLLRYYSCQFAVRALETLIRLRRCILLQSNKLCEVKRNGRIQYTASFVQWIAAPSRDLVVEEIYMCTYVTVSVIAQAVCWNNYVSPREFTCHRLCNTRPCNMQICTCFFLKLCPLLLIRAQTLSNCCELKLLMDFYESLEMIPYTSAWLDSN